MNGGGINSNKNNSHNYREENIDKRSHKFFGINSDFLQYTQCFPAAGIFE